MTMYTATQKLILHRLKDTLNHYILSTILLLISSIISYFIINPTKSVLILTLLLIETTLSIIYTKRFELIKRVELHTWGHIDLLLIYTISSTTLCLTQNKIFPILIWLLSFLFFTTFSLLTEQALLEEYQKFNTTQPENQIILLINDTNTIQNNYILYGGNTLTLYSHEFIRERTYTSIDLHQATHLEKSKPLIQDQTLILNNP